MSNRFDTKQAAEQRIEKAGRDYRDILSPIFISDRYAKAEGVERGGWYVYDNARRVLVR